MPEKEEDQIKSKDYMRLTQPLERSEAAKILQRRWRYHQAEKHRSQLLEKNKHVFKFIQELMELKKEPLSDVDIDKQTEYLLSTFFKGVKDSRGYSLRSSVRCLVDHIASLPPERNMSLFIRPLINYEALRVFLSRNEIYGFEELANLLRAFTYSSLSDEDFAQASEYVAKSLSNEKFSGKARADYYVEAEHWVKTSNESKPSVGKQLSRGDIGEAIKLASIIQQDDYTKLPFELDNFEFHLLKALEKGYICFEQYYTAYMLYSGQQVFQTESISKLEVDIQKQPCIEFIKHQNEEAKERLQRELIKAKATGRALQYYTLNLKPPSDSFLADHLVSYGAARKLSDTSYTVLKHYIETKSKDSTEQAQLLRALLDLKHDRHSVRNNARNLLLPFIQKHYAKSYVKSEQDIQYIANFIRTGANIPWVAISDDPSGSISIVILPGETISPVLSALYGKNAVTISPHFGRQELRQQGAYFSGAISRQQYIDDGPSIRAVNSYTLLYPESVLQSQPTRPVEISNPLGLQKPGLTHNVRLSAHIRSAHDIYHANRISGMPSAPILWLIQLLTEKMGIAPTGLDISKVLEKLIDAEFTFSKQHETDSEKIQILIALFSAIKLNFSIDVKVGNLPSFDGLLLLVSLDENDISNDVWMGLNPSEFFSENTLDIIVDSANANDNKKEILSRFKTELGKGNYDRCKELAVKLKLSRWYVSALIEKREYQLFKDDFLDAFKRDNPCDKASQIITYILYQRLVSEGMISKEDIVSKLTSLMIRMNKIGVSNVFYWSANSGIYFTKEVRDIVRKTAVLEAHRVYYSIRGSSYSLANIKPVVLFDKIHAAISHLESTYEVRIEKFKAFCSARSDNLASLIDLVDKLKSIDVDNLIAYIEKNPLGCSSEICCYQFMLQTAIDDDKKTLKHDLLQRFFGFSFKTPADHWFTLACTTGLSESLYFEKKTGKFSFVGLADDTLKSADLSWSDEQKIAIIKKYLAAQLSLFEKRESLYRNLSMHILHFFKALGREKSFDEFILIIAKMTETTLSDNTIQEKIELLFKVTEASFSKLDMIINEHEENVPSFELNFLDMNARFMALARLFKHYHRQAEYQQLQEMFATQIEKLLETIPDSDHRKADFIHFIRDSATENFFHILGPEDTKPKGARFFDEKTGATRSHLERFRGSLESKEKALREAYLAEDKALLEQGAQKPKT